MNEERSPKGNVVLLTVIAIATLLVVVIGTTYAYFSVAVTTSGTASVLVKSANLGITFHNNDTISATNIVPGWSETKTFSIENAAATGTNITYTIAWTSLTNAFSAGALKYTMTCKDELNADCTGVPGSTNIPATTASGSALNILASQTIAAGKKRTYILTIQFPNTSADQKDDMNQQFTGTVTVTTENVNV